MSASIRQHLEECIEQLRRGELTETRLRELGEAIGANNGNRQSLLFLQSNTSSVTERVIGMQLIQDGVVSDGPFDAKDWPYKSVLEADKRWLEDYPLPGTATCWTHTGYSSFLRIRTRKVGLNDGNCTD